MRDLGVEVFRFFGRFVGRENRAEFIGLVLIIVVGYALLEADAASLGEVSAAPLMFHRLFTPLGAIMFTFDEAQKSGASLTRLVGVLGKPAEDRLVGDVSVAQADPGAYPVTVEGLTFSYPGSDEPVLREVNLSIPAGGSLALVGATGAGKSTLAALIAEHGHAADRVGARRIAGPRRSGRGRGAGPGEHPDAGDPRLLGPARRGPAARRTRRERRPAAGRPAHGRQPASGWNCCPTG